jgi:hypothetical protein
MIDRACGFQARPLAAQSVTGGADSERNRLLPL